MPLLASTLHSGCFRKFREKIFAQTIEKIPADFPILSADRAARDSIPRTWNKSF